MPLWLLGLVAFLGLASSVSGRVLFTLTATANDNNLGYVMGNSYTFTFMTGSSFLNTASSTFNSTRNLWSEETLSDDRLWAGVGGTGLTGSFTRPSVLLLK